MTAITRSEVAHLARLARLDLSADELDHYAGQLDVILLISRTTNPRAKTPRDSMSAPLTP